MKEVLDKIVLKIYKLVFGEEPTIAVDAFVKNLTFVGMGFGVSAVLGLATMILAGRILGPLEYGKYALIQAVAGFLSIPMLIGINTALIKHSAEKKNFNERKKIISTSYFLFLFFSLLSAIIVFIFSRSISKILGISFELFIYSIIFSFLSSAYLISISIAQGLKEMKTLSVLQVIYGLCGIISFIVFILLKMFSFKAIFYASSINYLVLFVLSIIIFNKYFSLSSFDKDLAKKILRYGLYASISSIAAIVYFNFDRIAINKFFGPTQLGIYGAYYLTFISTPAYMFAMFNLVFFPMASGSKDKEAIFKKINKMVLRLSILALFFVLLMGIIVFKLYGDKYQFNFWLCLLFAIASISSLINAIYCWCMNAIGEKGVKLTTAASIWAVVINILINIFLIPIAGFLGAVIAVILSCSISIIIVIHKKEYYKLEKLSID